jgi:hypothetical protein
MKSEKAVTCGNPRLSDKPSMKISTSCSESLEMKAAQECRRQLSLDNPQFLRVICGDVEVFVRLLRQ